MKGLSDEQKEEKLVEFRRMLAEAENKLPEGDATAATASSEGDGEKCEVAAAAEKYRGLNEAVTDADCHRFLRARNYVLDASLEMILNWYVWYNTPLPSSQYTPRDMRRRASQEGDAQEPIYTEFLPHSNLGVDKEGRPLYWEKTGLISSRMSKIKTHLIEDDIFNRHIYQQERMMLRMEALSKKLNKPIEKQVLIFDMSHLCYSLDFMSMNVMRRVLSIDQAMYPERLKYMFFINAPFFFTAIWAAFKPFIDPVTVDKIKIIGSNYKETLLKFIDIDQIPVELGGTRQNFGWNYPVNWPMDEFDETYTFAK